MRQNYTDNQDTLFSEKKKWDTDERLCAEKRIHAYALIYSEDISRKIQVNQVLLASEKEENWGKMYFDFYL